MKLTREQVEAMLAGATPGPWHWVNPATDEPFNFDGSYESYHGPSLRTVWEGKSEYSEQPLPEFILNSEADYIMDRPSDASLIAASPDLARALIAAWDALTLAVDAMVRYEMDVAGECEKPSEHIAMMRQLRAALGDTP